MFALAAFAPIVSIAASADAAPSAESGAMALQRFEEGRAAFEAGKYEAALVAFRASLELQPSPNSRLYIGRCLRALGKTASAFTSLRLAAREAQDRLVASGEKRYVATRDAANQEAAELEAKVPHATIAVPSDVPSDFRVTLDGEDLPRSSWGAAVPLDPGAHVVAASGHRVAPFEERFTMKDGDTRRVDTRATRIPTATLALVFPTRPSGFAVAIDGASVDPNQALAPRELDPGEHTIDATAPGHRKFHAQRKLVDREDAVITVKLEPIPPSAAERGTPKWMFYSVAAVSVVTVGAGSYFAILASSNASAEKAKDPLLRDPAVQDHVRSQATTANAFFIAGATLAIGAGILFFTTKWGTSEGAREKRVGAGAWFGAGGATFGVGGEL
jgi:hypothetical protein